MDDSIDTLIGNETASDYDALRAGAIEFPLRKSGKFATTRVPPWSLVTTLVTVKTVVAPVPAITKV